MSLSVVSDAHVAPAASLRSLDLVESKKPEDSSPSLTREKLLPSLGDTDPSAEGNSDAPDTESVVRGAKLPNDAVSEKELNEPECEFSCATQKIPSANSIEDPKEGSNGPQGIANGLDTVGVKVKFGGSEIDLERFTESDLHKFLGQRSAKSLKAFDKELTSQIECLAAHDQYQTSACQKLLYYIEEIKERRKALRTSSSAKIDEPTSNPGKKSSNASSFPNSPESKACSSPGSAKVSVFSSAEIQNSSATSIESTDEKNKKAEKTCEVAGNSQSIPTNNVEVKEKAKEITSEIISKPQTKTSARIAMFEGIANNSNETRKSSKFVIPVRRFPFQKISQIPESELKQEAGLKRTKKTTKKSKASKKKGKKPKKAVSKSSSKSGSRIIESTPVPEKATEEPVSQPETTAKVVDAAQPLTETLEKVEEVAQPQTKTLEKVEEVAQPHIETLEKAEEVAQLEEVEKCRPLTIKKQTPLLGELFKETESLKMVEQNPWLEEFEETKPLNIVKKQTTLPANSSEKLGYTAENVKIETAALQEEESFSTSKNLTIFSDESWPSVSESINEFRDVVGDFVQDLIDTKKTWKENGQTSKAEPYHHGWASETQSRLVDEILDIYLKDPETVKETITMEQRIEQEKKERMARDERGWQEMERNLMRKIAEKKKVLDQELESRRHKQEQVHRQKVNEERAKFQKKQVSKPVQEKQKVCDERMGYQKQQASETMQYNVAYSGGMKLQYRSDYIEKAKRDEEMWGAAAPKYFFIPSCPKLSTKDKLKIKIRNVFSKVEDLKYSSTLQRKCNRSKDKFRYFVEDMKMEARCQKTSMRKRITRMKWAARELLVRIQV